MRLEELFTNNKFKPYHLMKPHGSDYILFQLKEEKLAEQYIWEVNKPLSEQNNETQVAIKLQLALDK